MQTEFREAFYRQPRARPVVYLPREAVHQSGCWTKSITSPLNWLKPGVCQQKPFAMSSEMSLVFCASLTRTARNESMS